MPAAAAGHGAGVTAHCAALSLTQHAINTLTAAAHLRVLGWRRTETRQLEKDGENNGAKKNEWSSYQGLR